MLGHSRAPEYTILTMKYKKFMSVGCGIDKAIFKILLIMNVYGVFYMATLILVIESAINDDDFVKVMADGFIYKVFQFRLIDTRNGIIFDFEITDLGFGKTRIVKVVVKNVVLFFVCMIHGMESPKMVCRRFLKFDTFWNRVGIQNGVGFWNRIGIQDGVGIIGCVCGCCCGVGIIVSMVIIIITINNRGHGAIALVFVISSHQLFRRLGQPFTQVHHLRQRFKGQSSTQRTF